MDYGDADRLLEAWGKGEKESLDQLMALVYHELHRMASGILRGESTGVRTRPTSLVNELYVELQRQGRLQANGQKHFFSIAAYLMRQILVQNARKRTAQKRGPGAESLSDLLDGSGPVDWQEHPETMIALNECLARLAEFDPIKASIVDMRFFGDLSIEAIAEATDLSTATVKRHWSVARLWLYEQLREI